MGGIYPRGWSRGSAFTTAVVLQFVENQYEGSVFSFKEREKIPLPLLFSIMGGQNGSGG